MFFERDWNSVNANKQTNRESGTVSEINKNLRVMVSSWRHRPALFTAENLALWHNIRYHIFLKYCIDVVTWYACLHFALSTSAMKTTTSDITIEIDKLEWLCHCNYSHTEQMKPNNNRHCLMQGGKTALSSTFAVNNACSTREFALPHLTTSLEKNYENATFDFFCASYIS